MGKGDKRTRKGKISAGSYGNSRPHGEVESAAPAAAVKKPAVKKPAAKKAASRAS